MNEIEVFDNNQQETYRSIRNSVIAAQGKVYSAVNSAMVNAYWEIGEQIYRACGENDRAEYGKNLLRYLSERLTAEFGKGFDESNLRRMRQFYLTFPIRDTLCHELSWSHYRVLMRISDKTARDFYTEECAKSAWSVRQLERQINTMYYQRLPIMYLAETLMCAMAQYEMVKAKINQDKAMEKVNLANQAKSAMTGYEFILRSRGKARYNGQVIHLLSPDDYVKNVFVVPFTQYKFSTRRSNAIIKIGDTEYFYTGYLAIKG